MDKTKREAPLADRMRPQDFADFVGQAEIIGPDKPLRQIITQGKLPSFIFWGPPGSGKTTLANIIARATGLNFIAFSAVTSGVKDIKEVVARAQYNRDINQQGTILFVDEIHRFNKTQQDAFLPHVEKGVITLIGATTENPSFEVTSPLLSRCRVFVLKALVEDEVKLIIKHALADKEHGLGRFKVKMEEKALAQISNIANGDARVALNLLELSVESVREKSDGVREITAELVSNVAQRKMLLYDRAGEEHYNIISALHKSMRGSDPDAALYWLGRMIEAGEDPLYVARRMVRFASEDIGNADPQALQVAIAAKEAVDFVGLPECNLALAQAAVYLATAPKSNAIYKAYQNVQKTVKSTQNLPVPLHLRNPVTSLMDEVGYGRGYEYQHDKPDTQQTYLPDNLKGKKFYEPKEVGFEREIIKRLEYWKKMKDKANSDKS